MADTLTMCLTSLEEEYSGWTVLDLHQLPWATELTDLIDSL